MSGHVHSKCSFGTAGLLELESIPEHKVGKMPSLLEKIQRMKMASSCPFGQPHQLPFDQTHQFFTNGRGASSLLPRHS